jgi:asparagine synthase (glutamine-hydrolysing)
VCGIAGVISREPADISSLDEMLRRLAHRGPDDHGWLVSDGHEWSAGRGSVPRQPARVALGHRRLSIIDLSPAGWQPMTSPDRRYAIVFNGEIYNYLELRQELDGVAWPFASATDTEVLLAGWSAWGPKVLDRAIGMFAFCLVDFGEQRAYLARDQFGIKPLFFSEGTGSVIFASEINALLGDPRLDRSIDVDRTYDYLRFGLVDHDDGTMLASIERVPAGCLVEIDLAEPLCTTRHTYWNLPEEREPTTFDAAVTAVRDAFEESVRIHLRSDVPVGFALSGGVDSSAIATVARRVIGPGPELHAFSYIADDPRLDEGHWARMAADAAGARVHPVGVPADGLRSDLEDLIASQGEPLAGTSIYAQRRVFAAAREAGVPVLLDGQGADELFGGYRSHLAGRFEALVRSGDVLAAAQLARAVAALPDVRVTPRTALRVAAGTGPAWLRPLLLRGAGLEPFPWWMDAGWFKGHGVAERGGRGGRDKARTLAAAFSRTSLPSLLRYEDRNSMRFSVESRVPFLERALVELVFRLPEEHVFGRDGTTKRVFREAMRGIVPDPILDRRDKIGFTTPERRWLADDRGWTAQVLKRGAAMPWFESERLCRRLDHVLSSGAAADHTVWRWLNLTLWVEATGAKW